MEPLPVGWNFQETSAEMPDGLVAFARLEICQVPRCLRDTGNNLSSADHLINPRRKNPDLRQNFND
jgi:hypothetical protein